MSEEQERTFTQAELDKIVTERLRKERAKYEQEAQRREAELSKRERYLAAMADWQKRGLPVDLLESLDYANEDALASAAAVLEKYVTKPEKHAMRGGFESPTQLGLGGTDQLRGAFGLRKDE